MPLDYDPNLLLDYLEGDLSEAERAQFEAKMAGDADLAALVRELKADRTALRGGGLEEPPEGLCEDAIERLERGALLDPPEYAASTAAPVSRFKLGPLVTYTGIAAALALAATVVYQSLELGGGQPMNTQQYNVAQAPIDAQRGLERAAGDESLKNMESGALAERAPAEMDSADDVLMDKPGEADPVARSAPPAMEPSVSLPEASMARGGSGELAEDSRERVASLEAVAANELKEEKPAGLAAIERARLSMHNPLSDEAVLDALIVDGERKADGRSATGMAEGPLADAEEVDADALAGVEAEPSERFALARRMSSGLTMPVSVNVRTDSAMKTRAQLEEWAVFNRIQVAELSNAGSDAGFTAGANASGNKDEPSVGEDRLKASFTKAGRQVGQTQQQLVVFVDQGQVDELVEVLARGRLNQQAQVIESMSAYKNKKLADRSDAAAIGARANASPASLNVRKERTEREANSDSLGQTSSRVAAESKGELAKSTTVAKQAAPRTSAKESRPGTASSALSQAVAEQLDHAQPTDANASPQPVVKRDMVDDKSDLPRVLSLDDLVNGAWRWHPAETIAVQINIDQVPEAEVASEPESNAEPVAP